ncbi:MAG: stage II sporulation protein M, partial [Thermofilaceae archaeon]
MQKYSVVRKLQVTTILAYLTGIVIGFYVPESLAYTLLEAVKELAGKTFRENPWEFALEIFIHNMEAVIITVLLSPLVLIPMLAVFVNGVILGVAINYLL